MLGAVFLGKQILKLQEVTVREPDPEEITIKVAACGVCGTDLHIYSGDQGAADCPPGTILGHEFAGIVVKIGSAVKNVQVGDRVSVDPNDYCGFCEPCRNGKSNFCENMTGIGTTTHGGFAEYCTFKAKQAYQLPDNMSLEQGAMGEPVGCCLHGIDLSRIKTGDTVLVIGAGTIGLMMMQLAKKTGAAKIVIVEPIVEKHAMAYQLGADLCLNPKDGNLKDLLAQHKIPEINVSIECVGLPVTILQAIEVCGRGGTVMMFGLTSPESTIPLMPFDVFRRELHLTASFINPYTLKRALTMIETGGLQIEPLIGARVSLKDIEQVFTDPSYRKLGKILIIP
ncbi:MAG: zinc-dependent alcohol dehydrogenase family protein [Eubacteriales bacterium]|nr:zinc-dependent alcohol dehydrogenase family protein [Eubacteriales bacterium]